MKKLRYIWCRLFHSKWFSLCVKKPEFNISGKMLTPFYGVCCEKCNIEYYNV